MFSCCCVQTGSGIPRFWCCSRALSVTLPTPSLGPGAHLPACARPGLTVRTRVWSGFLRAREPPRSALVEAVARLREMSVGMVRHQDGGGEGGRAGGGMEDWRGGGVEGLPE